MSTTQQNINDVRRTLRQIEAKQLSRRLSIVIRRCSQIKKFTGTVND